MVSGARTRGLRPVSTQVDGGRVCLGSTMGPSLLFSLRSCCSGALSPEACLTHFLPAERSPSWTLCRGLYGVARTGYGLGFTDLRLCLGGRNRAPRSQRMHLPLRPPLSLENKPAVAGKGPCGLCRDAGLTGIRGLKSGD